MSDLLKIHRAVNNDSDFAARVEIACSLAGAEYDRDVLINVAKAVVDKITITDEGAIDSHLVKDEQITQTIGAYFSIQDEEEGS